MIVTHALDGKRLPEPMVAPVLERRLESGEWAPLSSSNLSGTLCAAGEGMVAGERYSFSALKITGDNFWTATMKDFDDLQAPVQWIGTTFPTLEAAKAACEAHLRTLLS